MVMIEPGERSSQDFNPGNGVPEDCVTGPGVVVRAGSEGRTAVAAEAVDGESAAAGEVTGGTWTGIGLALPSPLLQAITATAASPNKACTNPLTVINKSMPKLIVQPPGTG
jgi:hypothetical protein